MHLCQFVGDSVGNVGSGGGSAVGAEDDSVLEVDRHAMIQSEGVPRDGRGIIELRWTHIEVPRLAKEEVSDWLRGTKAMT